LEKIAVDTPWVLLLDVDEVVQDALWQEIGTVVGQPDALDAYITRLVCLSEVWSG
jgi:hypothetical protein